ncbi:MAG: hypothetical protein RLZZ206_836 [Cyanobacteriota bacterium]|jgi:Dyp-type peroxidase family
MIAIQDEQLDLSLPFDDREIGPAQEQFLANLQANILKGHGRDHVALLFLEIVDIDKARDFVRNFQVSDALTQLRQTQAFKQTGQSGDDVQLLFLSQAGLNKFGRGSDFEDVGADLFSAGMKNDIEVLDNGSTQSWQPEFKRSTTDLLLLFAATELDDLARATGNLSADQEFNKAFEIILVQEGLAYHNKNNHGVEHFGYVDGRSQPLMLKSAIEAEANSGGIDQYDPSAPLNQFLVQDPLSDQGFGSYFVFRKLEQDVAGFKRAEEELSSFLGARPDQEVESEQAGAMVVGRFENGFPVTSLIEENGDKQIGDGVEVANNFNFDQDQQGSKCPFHAHIRKTNPRSSGFDKSVQMARRGITYGMRLQHPETKEFIDKPNDGVGLLFMSYQASIEDQFHFMQTSWANNEAFPDDQTGLDPVIGELGVDGHPIEQSWPLLGNQPDQQGRKKKLFAGFVSLKGGEYFFAPSIAGIRSLGVI